MLQHKKTLYLTLLSIWGHTTEDNKNLYLTLLSIWGHPVEDEKNQCLTLLSIRGHLALSPCVPGRRRTLSQKESQSTCR